MPIYTYKCENCGVEVEQLTTFVRRDCDELKHDCGGRLVRLGRLERPAIGKPEHQMGAVLANGAKLKGHFGKEAKRHRR